MRLGNPDAIDPDSVRIIEDTFCIDLRRFDGEDEETAITCTVGSSQAPVIAIPLHFHSVTQNNTAILRQPYGMPHTAPLPAGRVVGYSIAAWIPYAGDEPLGGTYRLWCSLKYHPFGTVTSTSGHSAAAVYLGDFYGDIGTLHAKNWDWFDSVNVPEGDILTPIFTLNVWPSIAYLGDVEANVLIYYQPFELGPQIVQIPAHGDSEIIGITAYLEDDALTSGEVEFYVQTREPGE